MEAEIGRRIDRTLRHISEGLTEALKLLRQLLSSRLGSLCNIESSLVVKNLDLFTSQFHDSFQLCYVKENKVFLLRYDKGFHESQFCFEFSPHGLEIYSEDELLIFASRENETFLLRLQKDRITQHPLPYWTSKFFGYKDIVMAGSWSRKVLTIMSNCSKRMLTLDMEGLNDE